MCIRDSRYPDAEDAVISFCREKEIIFSVFLRGVRSPQLFICLLYTSDAADERSSVDLGGRRIINKKTNVASRGGRGQSIEEVTLH